MGSIWGHMAPHGRAGGRAGGRGIRRPPHDGGEQGVFHIPWVQELESKQFRVGILMVPPLDPPPPSEGLPWQVLGKLRFSMVTALVGPPSPPQASPATSPARRGHVHSVFY